MYNNSKGTVNTQQNAAAGPAQAPQDNTLCIFACGCAYHRHCLDNAVKDKTKLTIKIVEVGNERYFVCKRTPRCLSINEASLYHVLYFNRSTVVERDVPAANQARIEDSNRAVPSYFHRFIGMFWGRSTLLNREDWWRFKGRRSALLALCAIAGAAGAVLPKLMGGGNNSGEPSQSQSCNYDAEFFVAYNALRSIVTTLPPLVVGVCGSVIATIAQASSYLLAQPTYTTACARQVNATLGNLTSHGFTEPNIEAIRQQLILAANTCPRTSTSTTTKPTTTKTFALTSSSTSTISAVVNTTASTTSTSTTSTPITTSITTSSTVSSTTTAPTTTSTTAELSTAITDAATSALTSSTTTTLATQPSTVTSTTTTTTPSTTSTSTSTTQPTTTSTTTTMQPTTTQLTTTTTVASTVLSTLLTSLATSTSTSTTTTTTTPSTTTSTTKKPTTTTTIQTAPTLPPDRRRRSILIATGKITFALTKGFADINQHSLRVTDSWTGWAKNWFQSANNLIQWTTGNPVNPALVVSPNSIRAITDFMTATIIDLVQKNITLDQDEISRAVKTAVTRKMPEAEQLIPVQLFNYDRSQPRAATRALQRAAEANPNPNSPLLLANLIYFVLRYELFSAFELFANQTTVAVPAKQQQRHRKRVR